MVTPASLLPPNATALERAVADTMPRQLLEPLADAPRRLKSEPHDAVVPWLAAEWFLADFTAYFPDTRALIAAGLPWLRVRGTAAAVQQALSWIGVAATLEEDGARLQLDPGTPAAPENLADIRHLVNASIPAHVLFYRLYHGHDLRPLRLDASRLDDGMLDDDSGVWRDGVKLSFGTRAAALVAQTDDPIRCGYLRLYSTRIWDDNSWRLDAWALDSEILIDVAGGIVSQLSAVMPPEIDAITPYARLDDFAPPPLPDDDLATTNVRTDMTAAALPSETRGWPGPWRGPWREPIPTRTTFDGG